MALAEPTEFDPTDGDEADGNGDEDGDDCVSLDGPSNSSDFTIPLSPLEIVFAFLPNIILDRLAIQNSKNSVNSMLTCIFQIRKLHERKKEIVIKLQFFTYE